MGLAAVHVLPTPEPEQGKTAMTAADTGVAAVIALGLFLLENSVSWLHTRKLVREFIPEN